MPPPQCPYPPDSERYRGAHFQPGRWDPHQSSWHSRGYWWSDGLPHLYGIKRTRTPVPRGTHSPYPQPLSEPSLTHNADRLQMARRLDGIRHTSGVPPCPAAVSMEKLQKYPGPDTGTYRIPQCAQILQLRNRQTCSGYLMPFPAVLP